MTVAAYYAAHVRDGRAMLGSRAGRLEGPTWIVRAQSVNGIVSYWICYRDHLDIEQVDPGREVATIRSKAVRQPRYRRPPLQQWLNEMARVNSLTVNAIM